MSCPDSGAKTTRKLYDLLIRGVYKFVVEPVLVLC